MKQQVHIIRRRGVCPYGILRMRLWSQSQRKISTYFNIPSFIYLWLLLFSSAYLYSRYTKKKVDVSCISYFVQMFKENISDFESKYAEKNVG